MSFAGQVVVITGVGREGQVGEALASAFCEAGARVVAVDRDRGQVEARAAALREAGLDAVGIACDLTEPDDVDALARQVRDQHGAIDALVHAAGGFAMSGAVAESDLAAWPKMLAINLTSAYLATRALVPLLRARHGAIVYFASDAVLPGGDPSGKAAYAASKAGVLALMQAVAAEEAEHGVRANAVAPTAIRTAANLDAMDDDTDYVEREEVAAVVMHLCSSAAARITGQVIRLA